MASTRILFITLLVAVAACVEAAPFFDAIYDAVIGNGRRTYGYDAYNGYNGYNGYTGYGYNDYEYRRREEKPQRAGKSWKDICKVHYPDSFGAPGAAGVVCPY